MPSDAGGCGGRERSGQGAEEFSLVHVEDGFMNGWFEYRNESAQTVPPFGIVRVTGVTVVEPGRVVLLGDLPDAYGCQYRAVVNGPVPVGAGKYGACTRGAFVAALYDVADGAPQVGERWGPRPGSWKLRRYTGGFAVLGVTRASLGLVLVQPAAMLSLLGKTDAAHGRGTAGTVSIYAGPLGGESDTLLNLTGVHNRYGDVPAGKWVRCVWNDQGNDWELVAAEC